MLPDELSTIDRYFRPLAGDGALDLRDDAGIVTPPPGFDLVVTTDMVARDVHFLRDPAGTIAKKALRVNISDLAAKGATPLGYVLSLALSPDLDEDWLAGFAGGLREDQREFGIRLLGGDTIAVPDRPVISITAFGLVPKGRMVRRSGGQPGDILFVSGSIGGSTAGLALLTREVGPWSGLSAEARDRLIHRYRVPEPRAPLATGVLEFASAAMDVSDGLVGDCDKLCAASGCTAVIHAERVPLAPFPEGSSDPAIIARLLTSGEDFEILAAVPPDRATHYRDYAAVAGVPVTEIGNLVAGRELATVLLHGEPLKLTRRAFVHGAGGKDQ